MSTEAGKASLRKANEVLLFFGLLCAIMYFGKPILIPITFAAFFAMLLAPLANRMERLGVKRVFTTLLSLLILVIAIAAIGLLVYAQARKLADQYPRIEQRTQEFIGKAQDYINEKLNVPPQKQDEMVNKQMKKAFDSSGQVFKNVLAGIFGGMTLAILVLIATFLFLFQREKYETFFVEISGKGMHPDESRRVIRRISSVAQSYLTGRVMSILIFTALFSTGFLIIGLEGAFLLAFVAALLTIVPYVGSIIGGLFPFAIALVTEDSVATAVGALAVVGVVQIIDNYFIEPYIIGGEVNLSALSTILVLFIGGLVWGVAGMVLFLPILGIMKIVFDSVPSLKPFGFLIGDQEEEKPSRQLMKKIRKLFGKKENRQPENLSDH